MPARVPRCFPCGLGAQREQPGRIDARVESVAVGAREAPHARERGGERRHLRGDAGDAARQVGGRAGEHGQRQVEVARGERAGDGTEGDAIGWNSGAGPDIRRANPLRARFGQELPASRSKRPEAPRVIARARPTPPRRVARAGRTRSRARAGSTAWRRVLRGLRLSSSGPPSCHYRVDQRTSYVPAVEALRQHQRSNKAALDGLGLVGRSVGALQIADRCVVHPLSDLRGAGSGCPIDLCLRDERAMQNVARRAPCPAPDSPASRP